MKFLPAASSAASLFLTNNYHTVSAFVTPNCRDRQTTSSPILPASTRLFSAVAPQDQDAQQQQQSLYNNNSDEFGEVLTGEVLSFLQSDMTNSNNGRAAFAVVKVCEEDLLPNSAYEVAKAMATADAAAADETGDVSNEDEEEEDKVELASALFGKPMPEAVKKSTAASEKNGGAVGAFVIMVFFCSDCKFFDADGFCLSFPTAYEQSLLSTFIHYNQMHTLRVFKNILLIFYNT